MDLDEETLTLLGFGEVDFNSLRVHREQETRFSRKSAAWHEATARYKQSPQGRAVKQRINRMQYEKLKSDPKKYAAWLAANKARYHERKARHERG